MLSGEHLARAAEAGDHFVGDQQDTVSVADLAEPGPVIVTGDGATHGTGNGLREYGGDGLGVLELDHFFDGVDAKLGTFLGCFAAEFTAVGQRLWDVKYAGHQRFVIELGVEMGAAQGPRTHGGAVI